jgi:hypothetical protein
MNVEWKEIPGYEQKYLVGSNGRIVNIKTGRILRPGYNKGYTNVSLSRDGMTKSYHIPRLVAEAFIPNPHNKPCIEHIDSDTSNNSVENLRWIEYCDVPRPAREFPLNISKHLDGFQVRLKRNGQLYHKYCKTLAEAIAWKEATLATINAP